MPVKNTTIARTYTECIFADLSSTPASLTPAHFVFATGSCGAAYKIALFSAMKYIFLHTNAARHAN